MKHVLIVLSLVVSMAAFAADDDSALAVRLEKVNSRLAVFEKSKDRFFVEQHNLEIRRLRAERREIEAKLAKARLDRGTEEFSRKSEALKEAVEAQWSTNAVIDVSHVPNVPELPAGIASVQIVEQTAVWERGCGKAYAENGVIEVDGGDRPTLWVVRREYDADGRLIKVTPVRRQAVMTGL